APRPIRPRVPHHLGREFVYVLAAAGATVGRLTTRVLPRAGPMRMTLFLRHLADPVRDSFLVWLGERAGWPRAQALAVPEHIRLLEPSAYSPEVNPAEHIWDELLEKTLPTMTFRSLDGLVNK